VIEEEITLDISAYEEIEEESSETIEYYSESESSAESSESE